MKNKKGFTLLEVIIAMTIMAFLSMYTAQAIRNGVRSKVKIQKKIDQQALLLDALAVISKDIQRAFNYRDINVISYNKAQKARQKRDAEKANQENNKNSNSDSDNNDTDPSSDTSQSNEGSTGQAATDAEKYKLKEEILLTHFLGSEDEVHFTSLSNIRRSKNEATSNQAEVGYFTNTCKNRLNKKESSKCLWRRITPYIDDEVDKGGPETVLLENVEEFRLRYLGPAKDQEWVNAWKTNKDGDDETKGIFPYAVEITITIQDQHNEKNKISMTAVAAIRFSNNLEEKNEGDSSGDNNESTSETDES